MKRLYTILILTVFFSINSVFGSHKVYIIHGYANPRTIMNKIYKDVKKAGYTCENYAYDGLYTELDTIGKNLYLKIMEDKPDSVSFITHSMGGLVVRAMLKFSGMNPDFPYLYRIIMIAPPNEGADIADFFKSTKSLKKILGPNVEKMETDSTSYANKLPIPFNTEIGILVGVRKKETGYNPLIVGDNDGLLKPERVILGNEKDIVYVKFDHFGIIRRKKPRKLVVEFLKFGDFISG
jgi:hypothetical protein